MTATGFRHEALFYDGLDEFRDRMVPFIRDGLEADEDVVVVVSARKVELLQAALGADADAVRFADMADVGRNPARIIPAWRQFVGDGTHAVRGVGEPAYAERTPDELEECKHHEQLLNLAFAGRPQFWLLCPYDTGSLDPAVVAAARRTHPLVGGDVSGEYDADGALRVLDHPLPAPPSGVEELGFDRHGLDEVRRFVTTAGLSSGLPRVRLDDLVLAVHEVAANSVRHAGGRGLVRAWHDGHGLVCEVRDDGRIGEPMIGRVKPGSEQETGRGLWIVNQLCDLVQVRSTAQGTAVRLRMDLPAAPS